jgi:hypothetical protein
MKLEIPKGLPFCEVLKIVRGCSRFEWRKGEVYVWGLK